LHIPYQLDPGAVNPIPAPADEAPVGLIPEFLRYRLSYWWHGRRLRRAPGLGWRGRLALLALALLLVPAVGSVALVGLLRWVDPPVTSLMLQKWREAPRGDAALRYRWSDLEDVSPQVALAMVAAEDQTFPSHSGFDVPSMLDALSEHVEGRRTRGASTISQQVAKNLFLWPQKSLLRKGLEAWFTVWIEALWPKLRILEMYLNVVELGPGVFGVTAASEAYFGRSPAELDARQAALIAAVLPNPSRLRIDRPSRYVLDRRDWILDQMRMLGGPDYLQH